MRLLLAAGALAAVEAVDGMTALHFACQKGHLDCARALLSAGARAQCRTAKGATPLHYAVALPPGPACERLVQLLLRKKADPLAQNKQGKTPLELATTSTRALLLKAGERAVEEPQAAAADAPQQPVAAQEAEAHHKRKPQAAEEPDAAEEAAEAAPVKRTKVELSFHDGDEAEQ